MSEKAAWVVKRAKCTLPGVLETLRDHAAVAVRTANAILPARLKDFPFELHDKSQSRFTVTGYPMGTAETSKPPFRVSLAIDDAANNVHVNSTIDGGPDFRIAQEWDVLEERCKLRVWSTPEAIRLYEPEQIVQLALEPLFFV